ncbi:MAG: ankyrin repeat domain-containing protein [Bacteroidota bacterium]
MNAGDWKGFISSVTNGDIDGVNYYLSAKIDVNFIHSEIMTSALIEAVRHDQLAIIRLLMENGANPKIASPMGESPILLARQKKNDRINKLLLIKK